MPDQITPPTPPPEAGLPPDFHKEDAYESLGGGIRTFREHGRIPSIDTPTPTDSELVPPETGEQPAATDSSAGTVPKGRETISKIRRNLEEMGERL